MEEALLAVAGALVAVVWAVVVISVRARSIDERARKKPPSERLPRKLTWLMSLSAIAAVAPSVTQAFTAPHSSNLVASTGGQSGATTLVNYAGLGALAILILVIILTPAGAAGRTNAALVFAFLPSIVVALLTVTGGDAYPLGGVVSIGCIFALWLANARVPLLRVLAHATWAVAALSIALGAFIPHVGLMSGYQGRVGTADKAIIGDSLLMGPFEHANSLGMVLALGAVAVLLIRDIRARILAWAVIGFALAWSGSRTSMLAAGIALAVVLIVRKMPARLRGFTAGVTLLVAGALIATLPLANTNPHAYSDRGQIWMGSLDYWRESPLTGNGIGWYSEIADVQNNLLPQAFHGHNIFINALATGGLVLVLVLGLVLVVAGVISAKRAREGQFYPLAFMIAFLILGSLEVVTNFRDITPTTFVAVLPLAVILIDGLSMRDDRRAQSSAVASQSPVVNRSGVIGR